MNGLVCLQRQLQAHVLDGNDDIAGAIDSSAEVPAAVRLKVYSDAYRLRLIEALGANYPVLAKFLGENLFARVTQEYLTLNPSRHYSIRWFGHRLAEFLREFPDYRAQPWLAELAAWEWKTATAFDAADADALTVEQLAVVAPADWPALRFAVHPSVHCIATTTNIVQLVKAAADDAPFPTPSSLANTDWLIWRKALVVQYRSLTEPESAAFAALANGATFGELCAAMTTYADESEVPLLAASYLKTWIADECIAGIVTPADSAR